MAFDFDKYKRRLELDGWIFQQKKTGRRIDWNAKKKSFLNSQSRFYSVFNEAPKDNELMNFVDMVKKFDNKWGLDEALLIAPKCDRFALSKFIEKKEGIFSKGSLKKIISFRSCEPSIKISKEVRKKIVEEELSKPENLRKAAKKGDDYKTFKKICKLANRFEIGPGERKNERLLETGFKGFLRGSLNKEVIDYQSNSGSGRYDIFLPNRKIGIELKVLKAKADLERLEAQIRKYMKNLEYMCILIVNKKGYDETQMKDTINYIKGFGNVEVIVR